MSESAKRTVFKSIVSLIEARPNPMFSEQQRELVRFVRYYESGFPMRNPCAECGKKKHHWTMLCSFQALTLGALVPDKSGKVHPPLTGVCEDHLLAAETEEV